MSDYPAYVLPTTRTWCARSGTGPRKHNPRKVLPNTDLCGPCHGLFPRVLHDLVAAFPILIESELSRPARVYSDMPRSPSSEPANPSARWNPAVTLVLSDLADWYGFLGRTIAAERRPPSAPTPLIGPLTKDQHIARAHGTAVTTWSIDGSEDARLGLAAIVRWHHRWLSHHPALGADILDDALRFQWAANRALEQLPVQRIHLVGRYCQAIVEETQFGLRLCEGQLVGVIRHPADDRPSQIMCANHPDHAIPAHDWILLDQP